MKDKYNKNYYNYNNQNKDRIGNLFYSNIIKKNFNFKTYLDFGCGVGFLLRKIEKKNNIKTFGYEINDYAIKECLKNTKISKIYKHIDEISDKFDLISLVHIVEHISSNDLIILFKKLKKNLNYKGRILISTPAKNGIAHNLKKNEWIGFKDSTHINLKSYNEWKEFFTGLNFKIIKSSSDGLWDFPYKNIYLSFKFFKILILMFFQIFFGILVLKHDEGETLILILENYE